MRPLGKVLDAMLREIPPDSEIYPALADMRGSVKYAAPEQHGFWWDEVGKLLESDLGSPADFTEQWQREVADIFTDRKSYEGEQELVEK